MNKTLKTLDAKLHQDDIFALSQFAFQYELSPEEMDKKVKEAERHVIWGMFVDGNLAAKTHLIPLSVYIKGKVFKMGGISSVATWPEYRRQGLVKDLLTHALKHMRAEGQMLSFLYPFSFTFYRKYGWELAFNEVRCDIPMSAFKKRWNPEGYVRRVEGDLNVLDSIYTAYATQFTGTLKRDEGWWRDRVLKDKHHIAVAYNQDDKPVGYVIYHVKKDVLTVTDIAFADLNARWLLYQFIGQHDSMAEKVKIVLPEDDPLVLHVDDPRYEQKLSPYFMARIVDVPGFLQAYPFEAVNHSVKLSVEDEFMPENSGTYHVTQTDGATRVTAIQNHVNDQGVKCSVQLLTMMLLGYKRPTALKEAGLLNARRADVEALEQMIPQHRVYTADFF
ncbi:GNAT family N-acetyltransferase [Lentibacillus saliphilus]|uniref:GNAT family N-acetyltransferase n=1 Tax=Lentibacillus saliphilus TaxID=2737028 RepID=UPI001C3041D9|nr:GNAT family N-acetyltransferase [Lentibacillus saliphilus]